LTCLRLFWTADPSRESLPQSFDPAYCPFCFV
jgi:hypothetical protein